jgi:hypothetical protein
MSYMWDRTDRDPTTTDPNLDYDDAVELQLLLEKLRFSQ